MTHSPEPQAARVTSVAHLDLRRYAGLWHEIARLPNRFQCHCVRDITAHYSVRKDGLIAVRNDCTTKTGQRSEATAVARRSQQQPGQLQVRFAPDWLAWLPRAWADYWVLALDQDYRWAVVGEPRRRYLWLLSRNPSMSRRQLQTLLQIPRQMGYTLTELIVSAPLHQD